MVQVVVIEPDDGHFRRIFEALAEVGQGAEVFRFTDIQSFYDAMKSELADPVGMGKISAVAQGRTLCCEKIGLIIADTQTTRSITPSLWSKIITHLQNLGASGDSEDRKNTPARTVTLLLTAYDEAENRVDKAKYYHPAVYNLLLKPFDALVLKQTLRLALKPRQKIKTEGLYVLERDAVIELIKDVRIQSLTELGFCTESFRALPIGKVARYYGSPFEAATSNAVFAYCYNCQPIGHDKKKYLCSFSFLGVPTEQFAAIRRAVSAIKNKRAVSLPSSSGANEQMASVLILSPDESRRKKIASVMAERFERIKVFPVANIARLLDWIPPASKTGKVESDNTLLGTPLPVELCFDVEFSKITAATSVDGEKRNALGKIAGSEIAVVKEKKGFLLDLLCGESQVKYQSMVRQKKMVAPFFATIQLAGDQLAMIEFLSLQKVCKKAPASGAEEVESYLLTLRELTPHERYQKMQATQPQIDNLQAVFIDSKFCSLERAISLRENLKIFHGKESSPKFFLLAQDPLTDYKQLADAAQFDDVFLPNSDGFFLTRKVKLHCPQFAMKDLGDAQTWEVPSTGLIRTALPVRITSLSEVHVSMVYKRPLAYGDVRRFVLWIPNDKAMPEILAVCRHCEKREDGDFLCDFVFFGIRESELKYIRQWMRESYVATKDPAA